MKYFLSCLSLLVLLACETKVETVYKDVKALRASELYARDSVYAYMNRYKDQNKDLATTYYEKFKKEESTNPEKAVYDLKRSISVQPRIEAYKELASLLGKLGRNAEVYDLYSLFIYKLYLSNPGGNPIEFFVFGPPDEDTYYEYLVAGILANSKLYNEDIYSARESGFNVDKMKERLIADERIHMDRNSEEFKYMLLQFLSYEDLESIAQKPESFQDFLKSIRDTSQEFSIDKNKASEFNYERFNGIEEYDMGLVIDNDAIDVFYLPEKKENKNGWVQFNLKHRYQPIQNVNVVIYAVDTSETACPLEMRHIYHRLATYNDEGKLLDSKIISTQAGEDLMTADISGVQITTHLYKRSWKNPYKKTEFDNLLLNTQPLGSKKMVIGEDGSIREISAETGG